MRTFTLALIVGTLAATAAQAQRLPTFEKIAMAGKPQQIVQVVALDPECHPVAPPSVSLLEEPRQGHVTIETGREFPSFPTFNPRAKCNAHRAPALKIVYAAPANASGDDTLAVEFVDQLGSPRRVRYRVTIR